MKATAQFVCICVPRSLHFCSTRTHAPPTYRPPRPTSPCHRRHWLNQAGRAPRAPRGARTAKLLQASQPLTNRCSMTHAHQQPSYRASRRLSCKASRRFSCKASRRLPSTHGRHLSCKASRRLPCKASRRALRRVPLRFAKMMKLLRDWLSPTRSK